MDSYGIGPRDCDVDEQEETSTLRPRVEESNPMEEWTDEKHSLYLRSMEATFVDQLNESLSFLVARNLGSKHKFKVLRDGRWSKPDSMEGEAEASQDLSANTWIQHYRCSERYTNRKILTSRANTASVNQDSSCNFGLWRRDFVSNNAEETDQNFNVEGHEEDESDRAHEMKRTRTSISNRVPNNGQVVPCIVGEDDDVDEKHAQPGD